MRIDPGVVQWALFLVLGGIAVLMALAMTLTMSMYRAGLALMASFLALAGLYFMLGADLLGLIQVMMNVAGMSVMVLFMVMLMMDPGGEMMWAMAREMRMPGIGAFKMAMPPGGPGELSRHEPDEPPTASKPQSYGGKQVSANDVIYTCPMHPEVRLDKPGKCPKCGMALEPTAPQASEQEPPAHDSQAAPMAEQPAALELRLDVGAFTYKGRPLSQWFERLELLWNAFEGKSAAPTGAETAAAGKGGYYTCPMHPEIRRASPGTCPKCGMTLEYRDDSAGKPPAESASGSPEAKTDHAGHGSHSVPGGAMADDQPAESHHQMMVDMAMSTAQTRRALVLSAALAVVISALVARPVWTLAPQTPTRDAVVEVGTLLLGRYMIAFEGAALLIVAGIVTAVMLGRREAEDINRATASPPVTLNH